MSYHRDHNGKLKLSKEEALLVRDQYTLHKDFWTCNMDYNQELLHASIDVLHNSVEGNRYYVEFSDSQNGSRLVVYCAPCNKYLSSYDPFMSHDAGKNHKKCIQQGINKIESDRIAEQDIRFMPLNSSKYIFEKDSLEDMLDLCKSRVLGLQYLFKEKLHGPDSSYRYSCQLCSKDRLKKKEMFKHVAEDTVHNQKYLQLKFKHRTNNPEQYHNKCKEIEALEGKINHKIVDFTNQYEMRKKFLGGSPPPEHVSPPPSPVPTRARSPVKPSVSPPPPLVATTAVQTDPDELDQELSLIKELALIKINEGEQMLAKDFEAMELMLLTLQKLNMKMHTYYKRKGSGHTQYTAKYQTYVCDIHKLMKENFEK